MPLFFYKIWKTLKRTVFSLKWWKENWYLPWFFVVGLLVWIVSSVRGSAANFIKRTSGLIETERETIKEIERKSDEEETKLEEKARLEKQVIREETEDKLDAQEAEIEKKNNAIKDDSEAINKEINDALNL